MNSLYRIGSQLLSVATGLGVTIFILKDLVVGIRYFRYDYLTELFFPLTMIIAAIGSIISYALLEYTNSNNRIVLTISTLLNFLAGACAVLLLLYLGCLFSGSVCPFFSKEIFRILFLTAIPFLALTALLWHRSGMVNSAPVKGRSSSELGR